MNPTKFNPFFLVLFCVLLSCDEAEITKSSPIEDNEIQTEIVEIIDLKSTTWLQKLATASSDRLEITLKSDNEEIHMFFSARMEGTFQFQNLMKELNAVSSFINTVEYYDSKGNIYYGIGGEITIGLIENNEISGSFAFTGKSAEGKIISVRNGTFTTNQAADEINSSCRVSKIDMNLGTVTKSIDYIYNANGRLKFISALGTRLYFTYQGNKLGSFIYMMELPEGGTTVNKIISIGRVYYEGENINKIVYKCVNDQCTDFERKYQYSEEYVKEIKDITPGNNFFSEVEFSLANENIETLKTSHYFDLNTITNQSITSYEYDNKRNFVKLINESINPDLFEATVFSFYSVPYPAYSSNNIIRGTIAFNDGTIENAFLYDYNPNDLPSKVYVYGKHEETWRLGYTLLIYYDHCNEPE